MRTSQNTVSPHVSSNERKSINGHGNESRNHNSRERNGSSNNNNNNKEEEDNNNNNNNNMGLPMQETTARSVDSIATSATEYSTSFFPEATFGESVFLASSKKRSNEDKLELLERIERILRFAQKRLKKSRVEGFFEKKKRKHAKEHERNNSDGGILHVQHSDVKLDTILGNGSYNIVYSVKRMKGSVLNPEDIVVKTLRSKLLADLPMLAACAADLRKEGLLLAALQQNKNAHGSKNIVRCLGWAPTGLSAFANGCHDSFFLVLEKLDKTLTDTLREWKETEKANFQQWTSADKSIGKSPRALRRLFGRSKKGSSRSLLLSSVKNSFFRSDSQHRLQQQERQEGTDQFDISEISNASYMSQNSTYSGPIHSNECSHKTNNSNNSCNDQIRFWKMRLGLLMDLCGAISFLHTNRVIHRDLKPDNVGFDQAGNLKVFDFDVARVLPSQGNWGDYRNETFKMTRKVGSPRYMSPEVAKGERYNEKTDVYALGLLAYEILSLKRPFDSLSSNDRVGKGGNVYKDCVQVVVKGEEEPGGDDSSKRGSGGFRRQKRRNSMGSLPFRRRGSNNGDATGGTGSSGKLAGMFLRRRSHSRGSSKKQSNSNRRTVPKYANIRPLLPTATPLELAEHRQQSKQQSHGHSHQSPKQHSRKQAAEDNNHSGKGQAARKPVRSRSFTGNHRNASQKSNANLDTTMTSVINCHHHTVNDVSVETASVFWTRSLRCSIDRAWSYDIPTRPLASELKVLLGEELQRIEWHEEDDSCDETDLSNMMMNHMNM